MNLANYENYVLTNDIIEGGAIFDYDNLADWTALGADAQNGFSGVFNGNGYGYKIRIAAKSEKTRVARMRATGRASMRVASGRANGMIGQTIMRKRGRGNG